MKKLFIILLALNISYTHAFFGATSPEPTLANPLFQELGREAQDALGLAPEKQTPIFIADPQIIGSFPAYTNKFGIFVNAHIRHLSLSIWRHIICHETVHWYFHDSQLIAHVITRAVPAATIDRIRYHQENRADEMATMLCACEICTGSTAAQVAPRETVIYASAVDEWARPCMIPVGSITSPEGYLTRLALWYKAQERMGLRCRWHRHIPIACDT